MQFSSILFLSMVGSFFPGRQKTQKETSSHVSHIQRLTWEQSPGALQLSSQGTHAFQKSAKEHPSVKTALSPKVSHKKGGLKNIHKVNEQSKQSTNCVIAVSCLQHLPNP